MQFLVKFVPQHGGRLAQGDRITNIGLVGLDQVRANRPDIELSNVCSWVDPTSWRSLDIELSEEIARTCGHFLESCKIEVQIAQDEPEDTPLQHFVNLEVRSSRSNCLSWAIDPEIVKVAWMSAGAPFLWHAVPNEEMYDGPDDDHEYLGEATLSKLREGADNLQFDEPDQPLPELRRQARAINDSLLEWMTANPSTWNSVISVETISNINGHLPHAKAPAAKELRQAFPPGLVSLKATNAAIDARIAWPDEQNKTVHWKDALLNELSREDACIMGTIEKALAAVPNDFAFDEVTTDVMVRTLIRKHEGWLSNRQNVVDLLPPLWNDFYKEL